MSNERTEKNDEQNTSVKPDRETLHKTDPQKEMKGPISSMMHNTGESFKTDETKEEADEKRDRKL